MIAIAKNYCLRCEYDCKDNFPYCEGREVPNSSETERSNKLDFGRYGGRNETKKELHKDKQDA